MANYPLRSSKLYPANNISSDLYWQVLDDRYFGFHKDGLRMYLEHKVPPSHSLHAILTGNLFDAVHRLDGRNWDHLRDWVQMLHCSMPSGIYGDQFSIDAWLEDDAYDLWVNYYVPRVERLSADAEELEDTTVAI